MRGWSSRSLAAIRDLLLRKQCPDQRAGGREFIVHVSLGLILFDSLTSNGLALRVASFFHCHSAKGKTSICDIALVACFLPEGQGLFEISFVACEIRVCSSRIWPKQNTA
jgi:hypothetical protein